MSRTTCCCVVFRAALFLVTPEHKTFLSFFLVFVFCLLYCELNSYKVKRPQWHLAVFWLARLISLTADWLLVPGNYYRIVCSLAAVSSPPQDSPLPACILSHDVCQPKHSHNNITSTILVLLICCLCFVSPHLILLYIITDAPTHSCGIITVIS